MESVTQCVGPVSFLISSESPICRTFPASSFQPLHAAHDLLLRVGEERNEPLRQYPTQLGKLGPHLRPSTFPGKRNHRWRNSLGHKLCCLGGEVLQVKSSCSSYPFQSIKFFFFFPSKGILEPLW